eukprot:1395397-Prymnesium_polylepis.1
MRTSTRHATSTAAPLARPTAACPRREPRWGRRPAHGAHRRQKVCSLLRELPRADPPKHEAGPDGSEGKMQQGGANATNQTCTRSCARRLWGR